MKTHRTKIQSAKLCAAMLHVITTDTFEVKQLAGDFGISVYHAHNIIRKFGYRSMIVSYDERAFIIASRQARKPLVKSA